MTNGTLTTKDGSNTLKVTLVETQTIRYGTRYWRVVIIGDDGSPVYFRKECWDFIPDVPTLREQVEELAVGTRYRIGADGAYIWTKISDNLVAYYLTGLGLSGDHGIENILSDPGYGSSHEMVEVIS